MSDKITTHRGKVQVVSGKQHRWLHARLNEGDSAGDHTHRGKNWRGHTVYTRHTVRTLRRRPTARRNLHHPYRASHR